MASTKSDYQQVPPQQHILIVTGWEVGPGGPHSVIITPPVHLKDFASLQSVAITRVAELLLTHGALLMTFTSSKRRSLTSFRL